MRLISALLLATLCTVLTGCGAAGFLRYGLTQAHPGSLRRGAPAPDVLLYELDGSEVFLGDHFGREPLVLVFGSFT